MGAMFRTCAILALLACALSLRAESWDALRDLRAGDPVKVVDTSGREHKGAFAAFSADAILLQTGKGVVSIDRAHVKRVQVRSQSRRVRNVVIGAGVGVAVGVLVDQTLGAYLRNETGGSGRAVTYIAPIALFGGIAALVPPYRTVYRAH